MPRIGAGRVVHLLERHGWRRVGDTGQVGDWIDPIRVIEVDVDAAARFLAFPLDADEIRERLRRYGFVVSGERLLSVRVPTHRLWDVEVNADLYEELAKSIGYNATPVALPPVDRGALPSAEQVAKRRVEEILLAHGFYEVFTDGFYGRDARERLGAGDPSHPRFAHVDTLNSLDRGHSLLKNNGLGQPVHAVATSLFVQNKRVFP